MFIVDEKPKSIAAEAYRTLRTNIQYSSFDEEIRTIVVTSSEPGEGKSTTAGNIAISFAQAAKKTVIIDCDLRKPSLHKKFKISNIGGLSDILIGKEKIDDVIHHFNEELDELRYLRDHGKQWLVDFEQKEREKTGIKNLKVGYNRVFGYYIEVTKGSLDLVKDEFEYTRKQSLSNAERFITPELKDMESKILSAQDKFKN